LIGHENSEKIWPIASAFSIVLASLIIAFSQNLKLGSISWLENIPLAEIILVGRSVQESGGFFSIIRSGRI